MPDSELISALVRTGMAPSAAYDAERAIAQMAQGGLPKPLYVLGDSLSARWHRENSLTALGLVLNADRRGGYLVPTPVPLTPSGCGVRLYGFQDTRLNVRSTVTYVGGQARIPLPEGDYSGMTSGADVFANYPAAAGTVRGMGEDHSLPEQGLITWLQSIMGKRLVIRNLAEGGSTSTRQRDIARLALQSLPPGILLVEGSVNTGKNGLTLAQVEADMRAILTEAQLHAHDVIVTTPTTFGSAVSGYAGHNQALLAQAAMTRRLADEFGVDLLDWQAQWVSGTSADGQPVTGYVQSDGIHWTPAWAVQAATSLAAALTRRNVASAAAPKLLSTADTRYTTAGAANNASSTNVLRNGQLFGTGGSGGTPDGWTHSLTGSPTVAYTKLAGPLHASDGTLQVDYSGADGSNVLVQSTPFNTDLFAGARVTFTIEIELAADVANLRLGVGLLLTASGTGESLKQIGQSTSFGTTYKAGTYTLRTPVWVVPSDVTFTDARAFFQIVAAGGVHTNSLLKFRQARVDVQ